MPRSLIPLICALSVLALMVGACGSDSGGTQSASTKGTNTTQTVAPSAGDGADDSQSKDDPKFKNGVLTTPDLKVRITRHKVIKKGQKGNEYGDKPVIAFYFEVTNVSGDKVDPNIGFILSFKAYQDNNPNAENELEVGSLPDERFLDSQSEDIKKGGTVESAVAYELDDLETPVDLVAVQGLDEPIGKVTYKLR
jgi:hypothetical protein